MRNHDFVSDGFLALIVTALVLVLKLARSRVQLVWAAAGWLVELVEGEGKMSAADKLQELAKMLGAAFRTRSQAASTLPEKIDSPCKSAPSHLGSTA